MSTLKEKFDIHSLQRIYDDLDKIHSFANSHYGDNPQLFETIDDLTRVSEMLCSLIEQELKGEIIESNPSQFIKAKLSTQISNMKNYDNKI